MSLFSMLRARQTPHYNHFVALCYVRVEVIHRIKFLRYYLKAELASRAGSKTHRGSTRLRCFRASLSVRAAYFFIVSMAFTGLVVPETGSDPLAWDASSIQSLD